MRRASPRAEIEKLADLLERPPESLAYLEALAPAAVRALRDAAVDALYDADRDRFARVAAAAKLPPAGVAAGIAQRAFGPLLVSRVAALSETDRAIEIARHMKPDFLVEVAVEIDPRRASAVIAGIDPETTGYVAGALAQRGEFVAMGRFVGHLTREGMIESLARIEDADLLRISFLMDERDRLDEVIRLLGPERRADAFRAAFAHDLWVEALDLLTSVGDELRADLLRIAANVAAEVGADERAAVIDAAREAGVVSKLGPLRAALEA